MHEWLRNSGGSSWRPLASEASPTQAPVGGAGIQNLLFWGIPKIQKSLMAHRAEASLSKAKQQQAAERQQQQAADQAHRAEAEPEQGQTGSADPAL